MLPENIKKPRAFLNFSRGSEENSGINWVANYSSHLNGKQNSKTLNATLLTFLTF